MGGLAISPDQIAKFRLFNGQQNPLFPAPDPTQAQPAPAATAPPAASPSVQAAPSAQATQPAPPTPTAQPTGPSLLYGGNAASKPPLNEQDFAQANPDATKAFMPTRPVGDFDTGKHPALRHGLASLFAGMAEFGRPGSGLAMAERWNDQAAQQRAFDNPANQDKMKAGALNQAYQNYLQHGTEEAGIEHSQAETRNLQQNVPLLQHQQQFLDKVRTLKESGKYGSDQDLFNSLLPEASTVPGMTRQMIVDAINNSKALGPQFSVQTDKGGRPEFVQNRAGEKFYPDAQGKFADPEMQKQWDSEMTSHTQSIGEEENKEKRVAGYAADRQAQAFSNQQTEQGRKAASTSLQEINDAKNQQTMMEKLLSGKMNPASQTAAMFKLIGLEQPTGTHRIMPAEIEGVEQLGGLSDRLKQKLLSWKEGDRFDPDLIPDVVSTAKILTQNKLKTANDNLESTARVYGYKAPGSDGKGRLDKPEDYQDAAAGAGGAKHVAGGQAQGLKEGATGTGSDGKKYVVKGGVWVPQ